MWDLPGPGLEPVSPALAGGFLTTAPPGKSTHMDLDLKGKSFGRPDGHAQQEGDVKRGESHEKKAETGVMGPQAKELQTLERGLEQIPA
ncbi:hypothetical protein J1605_007242 [Eschrichtius robustus]|uniref:Uncharacterized protein n=1 Tax=Eschrichtius robustus TaxID=9764 RepID=A0AB34H414_ESCRO|nr:hypothetical protein J1605_007242 [Eschrichtius robustus]